MDTIFSKIIISPPEVKAIAEDDASWLVKAISEKMAHALNEYIKENCKNGYEYTKITVLVEGNNLPMIEITEEE